MAEQRLAHIDGLRVLALFGVLLYHFDVHALRGGFVAVDIFLLLSGYFSMVALLPSPARHSPPSLSAFYIRRLYRLFPSALATISLVVVLSLALQPPPQTSAVFAAALAALRAAANHHFYKRTGYFDAAARHKPLLHLWSLSLDIQLTVLLPLVHVVVCKLSPPRWYIFSLVLTFTILATTSFAAAVTLHSRFPSFVFHSPPTRLYPFALGALAAVVCSNHAGPTYPSTRRIERNPVLHGLIYILSVATIVQSYLFVPVAATPLTTFPTTLAAFTQLLLPPPQCVTSLLAHDAVRMLANLSYAIYLVHWPVHVYARKVFAAFRLSPPSVLFCTVLSLALATALHKGVERPCFRPRFKHQLGLVVAGLCTTALCKSARGGFWGRMPMYFHTGFSKDMVNAPGRIDVGKDVRNLLSNRTQGSLFRVGAIHIGRRSRFVFVGDSFAGHLRPGLHALGHARGEWIQVHATPGCQVFPVEYSPLVWRDGAGCRARAHEIWDELAQLPDGCTIVLANLWCTLPVEVFRRAVPLMRDRVRAMGRHRLIVLGEPPGLTDRGLDYFDCAAFWILPVGRAIVGAMKDVKRRGEGDGMMCAALHAGMEPRECMARWVKTSRRVMRTVRDVRFIDVAERLCDGNGENWRRDGLCSLPVWFDDEILYNVGYQQDGTHYSPAGSHYVGLKVIGPALYANGQGDDDSDDACQVGTKNGETCSTEYDILTAWTKVRLY